MLIFFRGRESAVSLLGKVVAETMRQACLKVRSLWFWIFPHLRSDLYTHLLCGAPFVSVFRKLNFRILFCIKSVGVTDVRQAGKSAPQDFASGGIIVSATEVSAKFGEQANGFV